MGSLANAPDEIYGREEDKDKIVDLLVNQVTNYEQLSVLPIVGVGGLGKTTLAQLVYNDERVSQHFDTKLWVRLSDNFDLRIMLKDIVEAATSNVYDSGLMSLVILQSHLWEALNQKRYLLVLDDVWDVSILRWLKLKSFLECGSKGSSIVVTTRLKKVANIMGTLRTYCLKELSEEDCWFFLKQRAFGKENEKLDPNLESIGRQIVKKCAGVPLVAKALGGLLRFKKEEEEWIRVKESEIWDHIEEDTLIMPSLGLSYLHLSSELRLCFVYCAVFPKNYIIEKQDLIFRWIAHGYISSNRLEEVEDAGDIIWNALILKSIFQEVKTTGIETTCKMHDLVHDLAKSIMQYRVPEAQMKANSLVGASYSEIRELVYVTEHSSSTAVHVSIFTTIMDHTRLRILKFESNVEELPCEIERLKHLRYLNLSGSSIHTLPHTLCGLRNLKFLILNNCSHLKSLPKKMRSMTNLRHILLEGCSSLSHMPSRIGELAYLKTLSLFIVGDKIGNQLDELEHLNLGGRLEIKHLERVQNHMNAKKANLVEKTKLRVVVLCWKGYSTSESVKMMDEKVLEALGPNRYLETLEIRGFKGRCFPLWMRKMHHVTKITIEDCPNCSHLTLLGDLRSLKSLYLRNLPALEYIDGSESKFPSLKDLTLYNLPNLKGFVKKKDEEIGGLAIENLGSLYINSCQPLILPSLPTLEELDAWSCSLLNLCSFSSNLKNITSLRLGFDTKSTNEYVPGDTTWEGPCNLKELFIWNAEEFCFPEKWFRGLKHLQVLVIDQCNIGSCFPDGWLGHLTKLEGLTISNCLDLVEVGEEIQNLHQLKSMELGCLPNMVSLPECLQEIWTLQSLTLYNLPCLTSLPDGLGNLTSLLQLNISDLPRVPSLPSTIQGMSNLMSLYISGCPQLATRCQTDGEDWYKIAHIPQLDIQSDS